MAVARLGKAGVLAPCVDADDSCTYVPSGFLSPSVNLVSDSIGLSFNIGSKRLPYVNALFSDVMLENH